MELFNIKKPIIGMVHVRALPGTPGNNLSVKKIIEIAIQEGKILTEEGVDVLAIENMHDIPYLNRNVGPEITSMMSIISHEIKTRFKVPTGVQILAGANKEALSVALSAGLDFIRAEGFVFSHVADEGLMNSDAGELLRYRKQIGADHIKVFTDIKKKHSSHQITSDVSLGETAHAAEFFKTDGLIITGSSTGKEASFKDLEEVRSATHLPLLVGSGVTKENVKKYHEASDALIIGSYFKKEGFWGNDLDLKRIKGLISGVK